MSKQMKSTWLATLGGVAVMTMALGCAGKGDAASTAGDTDDDGNGISLDDDAGDAGGGGATGGGSGNGPFFDVIGSGNDGGNGAGSDAGCAELSVTLDQVTPTLLLLIDQSGSMSSNFNGQSRWDAVEETLFEPGTGVVEQLQDSVRFGMALYTSNGGSNGGTCPQLVESSPALGNRDQLASIFAMNGPQGDTPTGESLIAIAQDLVDGGVEPPVAIVLATDGEPDTCAVPNPQNGQPESVQAAMDAHDLGVETYVISVGNDVSDTHLQEMANAGKGLAPQGFTDAPFWKALDTQQLVDAFGHIASSVISCEFVVDGVVDLNEMCSGTVTLDGQPLACQSEWDMADPSTLRLLGSACTTLKDGQPHDVDAQFPCGVVTIP